MDLKKFIMGPPMPDKNDPRYKERYEREVKAGRQFADKSGISYLAARLQLYANQHKAGFLFSVFGFVFLCFCFNVISMISVYNHSDHKTATSIQDSIMNQHRLKHVRQSGNNGSCDYGLYQHK